MAEKHVLKRLFLGLCSSLLLLAVLVSGGWTDSKAETPSPGTVTNPLIESWEFAEAVGAYDFRADTQQTLRPRSVPGMIGQTSQSVNMSLDGEMVSPYEAHLTVRMERAGLDPTPVTLVQEGSQTYVLKDGEKIPTQNPLGALAPTGNYASYLAAAENVAPCEGETFLPGTVACYTYDINGKRFAEFIRDQMQALLDRNPGALPSGAEVKVAPSPQLVKMSGTGKVMLDANNLPLRLVLNIDMPEVNQLYDSKSRAVVDFEFDPAAVQAAMVARTHDESLSGHLDLGNIDFSGLITFLVTVIPASLLVACRRRRWFYGAVAVTVVLSMVSVPLVQAAAYSRYFGGQVQAAEALNELFTLAGVTEAAPNGVEPRPNLKSAQAIETFEPSAYCGKDAGVNRDTDGDSLADDAEYCLGTNPYTSDSDYDGLSDGLETAGFEYNGKTWYSNPLRPDSNGDGQNDSLEWKTDDGYAAEWDLDGDGTPNIWDFDDDGDGVGDGLDYSPHSRTGYILGASGGGDAFAFDITGQYNGYVYLDMQVQPSDVNHLRYGVTALDWRSPDAQGQITELNGSVDDVRLIPMLEVETNVPPNYDLAQEYGVTVFTDTLGVGVQRLNIPLHPVGEGGNTEAFSFRMAYGPQELQALSEKGVQWRNPRIIWMVQAKLDQMVNDQVVEESSAIHTYVEPAFRVTGWQITKSGPYRSAIIGTPDFPDDDRQLFQILFGLSGTFLTHQDPDLDEIYNRFNGVNTPIEQRWGVTTTVAIDLPIEPDTHQNAGLVALNDRINNFVSNHYAWDTPNTVIIAAQSEMGIYDQDDLGKLAPSVSELSVNLSHISMAEQRSLALHMRDGTKAVQGGDLSLALMDRYKDAVDDALDDLSEEYPSLTAGELVALIQTMYLTWENGRGRMLSLDGLSNDTRSRPDSQIYQQIYTEPLNRFGDPDNISTLPGYLVEVGRFAQQGSGLRLSGGPGQIWQYLQANASEAEILGFSAGATEFFTKATDAVDSAMGDAVRFDQVDFETVKTHSGNKYHMIDEVDVGVSLTLGTLGALDGFRDAATKGLDLAGEAAKNAGKASKWGAKVSKLAKIGGSVGDFLGPASLGVEIGLIWTQFALDWALTGEFSPQALTMAIAATIVAVALFLLSSIPVWVMTAIVALVGLVDVILSLIPGVNFTISGEVTKAIGKFMYDVEPITEVGDIKFLGRDMELVDEEMGYVVGNRYRIADTFVGTMKQPGGDHNGSDQVDKRALELSWICGEFVMSDDADVSNDAVSKNTCEPGGFVATRDYDYLKRTVTYTNSMSLVIPFTEPDQVALNYIQKIVAQSANWEELWGGLIYSGYKTTKMTLPDDMPEKNQWKETQLVLDILPATLDGFWRSENTSVINLDPDGDGMTTEAEITHRLGTTAFATMEHDLTPIAVSKLGFRLDKLLTNWDTYESQSDIVAFCSSHSDWTFLCDTNSPPFWLNWDSDGDGLSDKYEFDQNGSLGTEVYKYDTDGDGLNDGQEFRLGTRIDVPDSDLDGLLDGEEAFHQNQDGTWGGGWTIQAYKPGAVGPSGRFTTTLPVFSDPRSEDGDGDGLSDLVEQRSGSSPTAYNRMPRVELVGSPLAVSPGGVEAVYVQPGREIALNASVQSFTPYTVAGTLSLEMPWHLLAAAQFSGMSGDSSPPNTGEGGEAEWSFADDPLLAGEEAHTEITAQTGGTHSMTGAATLRLPVTPVGWQPLGAGVEHSIYLGNVSALAVDPAKSSILYAGGRFDTAGGRSANNIARWSAGSWAALSSGLDGDVNAIAVDADGDVYAGGDFDQAGDETVSHIAKWDGSDWYSLGTGMNDDVYGLAFASNGDLYAVGRFSKAGGTVTNGVARWDGSSWSAVGSGLDNIASSWAGSVAVDSNDNVYIGGHFYSVSGVSTGHIAKWDGSSWSAMNGINGGGGFYGSVRAIAIDPATDQVYAGGDFYQVNGYSPESAVVRWNGTSWEILPNVANNPDTSQQECYALVFDGQGWLYAGGWWAEDGADDKRLVRWSAGDRTWTSIGKPVDESAVGVYAFAAKEEGLFVGGVFDRIDQVFANNVAFYVSVDSNVQEDSVQVVVDAENPTAGFVSPHTGELIGGGVTDYVIGGYSGDATTWVTDVNVNLPLAGTQVLTRTPTQNLSPWAYTWALPDDGVYNLSANAIDFVGNVSANSTAEVMVDNTPPTVTVDLSEGAVYGPPQNGDVITITLEGDASDTLSGLTRVQVSTDGGPWREVWTAESATITNTTYTDHSAVFQNHATHATWSVVWTLPNVETVQGYHNVEVRAFDLAGNAPQTLERTIIVDVIPPTDELVNRAYLYSYPHLPTNSSRALRGIANDVGNVPAPARPAELVGALDSVADATIWLGLESITENDAGVNIAWIGDFNGDRRGDLLVGTPASAGGAGRVSVIYGRSGDWHVPDEQEMLADSFNSFVGLPGAGIGLHAIPAGDVNADGIADLLIGDPANDRVFLIFGRPSYVGRDVLLDDYQTGERSVLTVPDGQQIGEYIGAAGDVNGDGLDDLLIGATGSANVTYLLLGTTNPWRDIVPLEVFAAAGIANSGGATLAGVGDLDGDFRDEFALGIGGNLYLFEGRASFAPQGLLSISLSSAADILSSADGKPTVAALGDVNGDQRGDFIYTDGNNQHLLFGDDDLGDASWTTHDFAYGSGFVAAAGDVDDDGLDDLFIGGSGDNGYLVLASDLNTAHATISGVAAAASAPHAAGADLNSDGSSDLLLLPTATDGQAADGVSSAALPSLPPDWVPRTLEPNLPTFSSSVDWPPVSGADAYVNDDGTCYGLTPCYTTIQAAVDARFSGDLIIVQPGVYAPFTVDNKDNMTVRGTDPDAVFVDAGGSGFAAHITNADGVQLEQMTLRNASYGVQLTDAGVRGHDDAYLSRRTILDHLLVYDVNSYDVYMDRSSTLTVTYSTLVNTGNHVGVNMSSPADTTVLTGWQTESDIDALYDGGGLAVYSDTVFYCTGNGARNCNWRDFPGGWFTPWPPANPIEANSVLAAGSDGQFYVLGAPTWKNVETPDTNSGAQLVEGGDGAIYVGTYTGPREWNGSSWEDIPDSPDCTTMAVHPVNGDLYCLAGPGVWEFGHELNKWDGSSWTELAPQMLSINTHSISDMAVDTDGNVHVVGSFGESGCYNYVEFSNGSWHCNGGFEEGDWVRTIAINPYGNQVYIGGEFDTGYGVNLTGAGGGVVGGPVTDIEVGKDYTVYIAGEFTGTLAFGGGVALTTTSGIVAYDWGEWSTFPLPDEPSFPPDYNVFDFDVYGLAETDGGELYAAGRWAWCNSLGGCGTHGAFNRWNGTDWEQLGTAYNSTNNASISQIAATGRGVFISGSFDGITRPEGDWPAQYLAARIFPHEVYSTTTNSWNSGLVGAPMSLGDGACYAGDADGDLILLVGGGHTDSFRYQIEDGTWTRMDDIPDPVNACAMTMGENGEIYAITDSSSSFYWSNGYWWDEVDGGQITSGVVGDGASLAYDSKNETYYAFLGGNSDSMLRYRGGSWTVLSDHPTPVNIQPGGGLVYVPGTGGADNALYAAPGNNSSSDGSFWRYPLPEPNKIGFDHSAIVVPAASSSGDWLSLTDPMPDDFNFRAGTGSLWFNSTGQPDNGYSLPTSSANPFLDQSHDLYRMGQSGYDLGYHTYTDPVTATTSSGIQTAINSGANRVVVEPGIYEEQLYLVNGVDVVGSNPDWTILRPVNSSDPLLRAEGVTGASISNVTLDGQDAGIDGLTVSGDAEHIALSRSLIYGTDTAVLVDGAGSDLEVANITAALNNDGFVATNNAPVDVRNSIFAYNSGVGLSHNAGASPQLHTYNLFWENNGGHFGDAADAGAAELFLDPNFVDPLDHDYRTLNFSPVIDAGNPTDPAPPSEGNRVDIGYVEQGRANYYVDDDYCQLCINDGLNWHVDAFDTIQDALDAAQATLADLKAGHSDVPQLIVGVAAGTYNEQVTVPSHVLLMGSGAEVTTLDGAGTTAVTFDGVTDSGVRDFTITSGGATAVHITGASNNISLHHDIILGSLVGVSLDGRGTGDLIFNTLVNNTTAVIASEPGSWVNAQNNILSGAGTGFDAVNNGQIINNYNLVYYDTNYAGDAAPGEFDLVGQDPQFDGGVAPYRITATSPALDAASLAADVPDGGGTRADMGYSELLAAPISLLLGKEDLSTVMGNSGVAAVEYAVVPITDTTQAVTATLPGSWISVSLDTPGETFSYWQTVYTPTVEGMHRFYSRATDVVGNQEDDETDWYDGSFVADSTPPVVEWLSPADGASLNAPLELRAQVSDYAAGEFSVEEKDLHFVVDGVSYPATWAAEPWDEAASAPRVFRAWITPTVATHNNVEAHAEDKAGNAGSDTSFTFTVSGINPADTTNPALTIINPPDGSWVTSTVVFSGTATDSGSGVASVEVSVDGGVSWRPATVSGTDWSLTWDGPEDQSFVSYPAWVRATDRAGNSTTLPLLFTVDDIPPVGLEPVTFNFSEETHFDVATTLVITWNTPVDGSGIVTSLLAVDQFSDTLPLTPVAGTGAGHSLDANGAWYVHLGAVDGAGNALVQHYGPWHVGISEGVTFGERRQSIIVDGHLDLGNGEWRTESEFLDSDERPVDSEVTHSPNGPQSFYTTWGGDQFYLAWQGAWWQLDGTLWVYLNTGAGGGSQLIAPLAAAPSATLPYEADYAVEITGPDTGTLWQYAGGWITSTQDWEFAQGSSGDTEIRLPLFGTADIETLAFAQGDDGKVWAVFPATNPLNPAADVPVAQARAPGAARPKEFSPVRQGSSGGWQSYRWDDITVASSPAADQPRATSLSLAVESLQSPQGTWGPGSPLQYVVHLMNQETYTMTGEQVAFIAIPAASLVPDDVQGATCPTTNPWLCTVDDLPPGEHTITVTVHLAPDLSLYTNVTLFAILQNNTIPPDLPSQGQVTHKIDGEPPETTATDRPFVRPGSQTFHGIADDGSGVGVDFVEVRPEGGSWQRAEGVQFWSAGLSVSPFLEHGDVWQFDLRATDLFGQTGPAQEITFTVDLVGPSLTLDAPPGLNGTFSEIVGTASDVPRNSDVFSVAVKLDDEPWREALVFAPDEAGVQEYLWTWSMPTEDGISHTLQVQATDRVGNVGSTGAPQIVLVDNVAPVLTVTNALTQVIVQDYRPGQVTDTPVLSGTASDGGGVASVIVRVEQPDGTSLQQSAVQDGQTWRYFPELTLAGNHRMRVTAIDELGNTTRSETFDLLVIAAPDTHSNEFVTAEDTPVAFEPLLDDLDLDGDTLFLTGLGVPLHGTASISGTTWVVYTPTLNFNGTDAFTYTASDGGLYDTATVTVTVTPVNDPPVIVAGDAVSVTMSEDNAPVAFGLTLNAHDVDDGVLTWDVAQGAMHGTATVSGSLSVSGTLGFSSTIATIAYAPDQDYYGPDSFGVRVSDGELADTLLVNVTVEPVNDAPQAQDDMAVILLGEGDSTVTMDVLSNDADLEGQPLTISAVGSPANGNVMISDDRYLLYTPAITGTESFTYTVTDGGLSDTATVHVTVVEGDSSAGGGETVVLPGVGTNGTMTVTIGIPADVTSGGEHFALIFGETAPPNDAPRDYLFAGLAFTLDVYVNGVRMDTYAFTTPLSLTIEYQESDVAHLMMGDAELALFYRDAGQWRNDDVTVVARDLLNNRFAVTIDHLSRFALFGWDAFKDYLPLVRRGAG